MWSPRAIQGLPQRIKCLGFAVVALAGLELAACEQACRMADRPILPSGADVELVDRSLLTGEPCSPPCWQGLMPGESTKEEVLAVLNELPFVQASSIRTQDIYGGWEYIQWYSALVHTPYYIGGISIDANDRFAGANIRLEYELTIQELIDLEGPPDFYAVEVLTPHRVHEVRLLWLEKGLNASMRVRGENHLLCPEILVWAVGYFRPASTLEEMFLRRGELGAAEIERLAQNYRPWEGYESVVLHPESTP